MALDISGNTALAGSPPSSSAALAKQQTLGQDDFFKILTAQLTNQNPTAPLDNAQLVAQMAQFSTATAVQNMQDSMHSMQTSFNDAQQLQAANLVGRTALAPGSTMVSSGQGGPGAFDLTADASTVTALISAPDGRIVRHLSLGALPAGMQGFSWNGLDDQGTQVGAGNYQLQVQALNNGAAVTASPYSRLGIQSVAIQSGQPTQVSLADGRTIPLSEIREIM